MPQTKCLFYTLVKWKSALWLSILLAFAAHSQEVGTPFTQYYGPKTYDAGTQIWSVTQDSLGRMYFGTGSGILLYNGLSWQELDLDEGSVRGLAADSAGKVYVAAAQDLGYMDADPIGRPRFQSLKSKAVDPEALAVLESSGEASHVVCTSNGVFFDVDEALAHWDGDSLRVYPLQKYIYRLSAIGNEVYISQSRIGINRFDHRSGKLIPWENNAFWKDKRVRFMLEHPNGQLLIGTRYSGLFLCDRDGRGEPKPFAPKLTSFFEEEQAYRGISLGNGEIAVATKSKGLLHIDSQGQLIKHHQQASGLGKQRIYALHLDKGKGLWLGTGKGIHRMEILSPFSFWNEEKGFEDKVRAVGRGADQRIYAGTNLGIYYLAENGNFTLIEGRSQTQCWGAVQFKHSGKEALLMASSRGVYELADKKANWLAENRTIYSIVASEAFPNRVYLGGTSFLGVLVLEEGEWVYRGRVEGVGYEMREMAEDAQGGLWIETDDNGLFKLELNREDPLAKPTEKRYYAGGSEKPIDPSHVFRWKDFLLVEADEGLLQHHQQLDSLIPSDILGEKFKSGEASIGDFCPINGESGIAYLYEGSGGGRVQQLHFSREGHLLRRDSTLFKRIYGSSVRDLFVDRDSTYWIGTIDGLFRYDASRAVDELPSFSTLISQVSIAGDSVIAVGSVASSATEAGQQRFPYALNSFLFQFSAPSYSNESKNQYRFRLIGYDELGEEWSSWSLNSQKEYTNLAAGDYIFQVQARNIYGQLGGIAQYHFSIATPWYQSWWAYILYVCAFLWVIWLAVKLNAKRLEREKELLEEQVQERTQEILLKNSELEQQREEILVQAENLKEVNNDLTTQKQSLESAYNNIKQVSEIGQAVAVSRSIEEIIDKVYEQSNQLMDASIFAIGIYQEEEQRILFPGMIEKGERLPLSFDRLDEANRLSVHCFKNKKEIVIGKLSRDIGMYLEGETVSKVGEVPESVIYLPLYTQHDGQPIGVLTVQSFEEDAYSLYQISLLKAMGFYISSAIENASAFQEIARQKNSIELQNANITASINYAKRIQQAFLPTEEAIWQTFSEWFVFFRPKDIVSGDFYWFDRIQHPQTKQWHTVIAVVDCTGHGVPGAFMSIIGNDILRAIVSHKEILDPQEILEKVNQETNAILQQSESSNRDGMDMGICVIEEDQNILHYAGARRPLLYTDDHGLHLINGVRRSIGGDLRHKELPSFEKHSLSIGPNMNFYLFSDGYQDQFGGPKNSKIGIRNFKKVLLANCQKPMFEQGTLLKQYFLDWKGEGKQIDDVLLVGFSR